MYMDRSPLECNQIDATRCRGMVDIGHTGFMQCVMTADKNYVITSVHAGSPALDLLYVLCWWW